MPQALDDITRRIAQKEIEREAIKREGDKAKGGRHRERTRRDARGKKMNIAAKWQAERDLIDRIQQNKIDIEQLNFEAERARARRRLCQRGRDTLQLHNRQGERES